MPTVIAGLDPASYLPHRLHDAERHWPQSNCYVDLLIEVMHAAGHEPVAALGFTVGQDFEGDQFTFFKFPTADLNRLAGLDIQELAIFDRLEGHALTQIERGRLPLVEVDAFYLPDTGGISYRSHHSKTTVGINALDPAARRMAYSTMTATSPSRARTTTAFSASGKACPPAHCRCFPTPNS